MGTGTFTCKNFKISGAVIVGSVDGNRIWGKEIKGMVLTQVQWSPDGKTILFGNSKGEVHIYDSHGTYNVSCVCVCVHHIIVLQSEVDNFGLSLVLCTCTINFRICTIVCHLTFILLSRRAELEVYINV